MRLFLDTASHHGLVALVDDASVVASREVTPRTRDDEVASLVATILNGKKIDGASLAGIACVTGPGGFTSVRVGVALANAWRWAWKLPLTGIHQSDLYRARTDVADCVWVHSTKKTEMFVRGFGTFAKQWVHPMHVTVADLEQTLPGGASIIGELIEEHQLMVQKKGCSLLPLRSLDEVLPPFLATCAYDEVSIDPWYGREG